MPLDSLIAQLEAAREGNRELSDQVLLAVGWFVDMMTVQGCGVKEVEIWCHPDGAGAGSYETARRPNPTRNVQDAIDWVVPEGWAVNLAEATGPGRTDWSAHCLERSSPYKTRRASQRATPALALCIAALRAREEE